MSRKLRKGDLRVWWIPNVPCKPIRFAVADVYEAMLLLKALAECDLFLLEMEAREDFSNAGGLEIFDGKEWEEWEDPESGSDIDEFMKASVR